MRARICHIASLFIKVESNRLLSLAGHISNHKLLPTPISTPHPTPTPKSKITSTPRLPSKAANRAPELTFSTLDIKRWVAQYITFIQAKEYWQAYKMLSQDIRAKLSFEAFLANSNYVLPNKGCWELGAAFVSKWDSLTWDEGVEMTNASCFDDRPIYYADWHFRVQWQDGGLAIVSIGLYPTAPAN